MKKNIVVYPGTFDPITNGHIDIIERAASLFDSVIVAIAHNSKKSPVFSVEKRLTLAKQSLEHLENVSVEAFDCLLVHFAQQKNASIIIRGLRAVSDFDYEFQLAGMNRNIAPDIETLFLTPSEQYTYISSSLVREIASLKADVSHFVPSHVAEALKKKYLD